MGIAQHLVHRIAARARTGLALQDGDREEPPGRERVERPGKGGLKKLGDWISHQPGRSRELSSLRSGMCVRIFHEQSLSGGGSVEFTIGGDKGEGRKSAHGAKSIDLTSCR